MQPPPTVPANVVRWALLATFTLTLGWVAAAGLLHLLGGAEVRWIDPRGQELARQRVSAFDMAHLAQAAAQHSDAAELRWAAFWSNAGPSRLRLRSDARAELRLDGLLLTQLEGGTTANTDIEVPRGGQIEVRFFPAAGARRLRLFAAPIDPRARFEPLDWRVVTPVPSRLHALLSRGFQPLQRVVVGLWTFSALALAFLLLRARLHGADRDAVWQAWPAPAAGVARVLSRRARLLWLVCGLVLTFYAAALRFEALVGRYWTADTPAWAQTVAGAVSELRPGANAWRPAEHPYLGDPFSYLRYAREQRGFYAAHVREPLFVSATRLWLWLSGDRDLAVNLASASFSVLVVPALLLLGSALGARWAGLVAAFFWAIEWQVVELSVEGWRDDAFAFFVTLSAWALLRLRARPDRRLALVAGVVAAAACLTRITSLSFLLPMGLLLALERDEKTAGRRRALLLTLGVMALLIAPFLVNCWRVYGDPFYAINAHTKFYRARSGADFQRPEGWLDYVAGQRPPLATIEMLAVGVSAYPFQEKWQGFDDWMIGLGSVLRWLALFGLLRWAMRPEGRALLLLGVTASAPFAFTWDIPGGAEWRFTLYAYPLLLLAATTLLVELVSLLDPARARASVAGLRPRWRRAAAWTLAGLSSALVLAAGFCVLRRGVIAETLRRAGAVHIASDWRHTLLFGTGWSGPVQREERALRDASDTRAVLHIPLVPGRAHDLTLRIQARGTSMRPVRALMNGREIAAFEVAPGPQWQAQSLHVPAEPGRDRWCELELVSADHQPLDVTLWFAALTALREPAAASGT
jgi:Dolichyl-phosphate-mannose-protein mannosyltransferase